MSGSGRGVAIAVVATTLLWLTALAGAGFWFLGRRDVSRVPLVVGPAEPLVPMPSSGPGQIPQPPAAPGPLPVVPAVPPTGGRLSRVSVSPAQGHLDELLRAEIAAAEASGRRVGAYFTAPWCQPGRAVDPTLAATAVDSSLGEVQLVEVDIDSFSGEELHRAGILLLDQDVEAIPLFCALRSRQPPVCIDGGAWGEDTDSNIRSILVPFLASPPSGVAPGVPDRITPI